MPLEVGDHRKVRTLEDDSFHWSLVEPKNIPLDCFVNGYHLLVQEEAWWLARIVNINRRGTNNEIAVVMTYPGRTVDVGDPTHFPNIRKRFLTLMDPGQSAYEF